MKTSPRGLRQGSGLVPSAAVTLPPAARPWRTAVLWLFTAALAGAGVGMVWSLPWVAVVCPLLCTVLAVPVVRAGLRSDRRRALLDHLVVGLHPLLGWRLADRAYVRVRRWQPASLASTQTDDVPESVRVVYAPGAPDTADWASRVVDTVARRLGTGTELVKHDSRRCTLTIRVVTQHKDPAPVTRAQQVVQGTFGSTAKTAIAVNDEGLVSEITVKHDVGGRVASARTRAYLEGSVSARLPGRWRARWQLEQDEVRFSLRPTMPTEVPHSPAPITADNQYLIPLAVDEDGRLVVWNLKGSGPHLMVVGKTGTGKTVTINGAVTEIARRLWAVRLCDPKRVEFLGMRDWPNVQIVATTVEDMLVVLRDTYDLMEDRYAQIEAGADESDFEPVVLVMDELRNFLRLVDGWWAQVKVRGMPRNAPALDWLAAIAEKGRTAQVHLLMGTQRPDASFLKEGMRDNFDTRLTTGRLSPQAAMMMWDSSYVGTTVPRGIRGRGTAVTADDQPAEVQVLWTPDPRRTARNGRKKDLALLDGLRPDVARHPRLVVDLGNGTTIDGEQVPQWQRVIEEARLVPEGSTVNGVRQTSLITYDLEQDEPDVDVEGVDVDSDVALETFEGYETPRQCQVGHTEIGDLVLVDAQTDLWAVVEGVGTDPESGTVTVAWRADDGEAGDLVIDDAEVLMVSSPTAE